tara:strand:- start:269 stop:388 length:120 start_codon:yes stop_codon:yes gene_type:complete
MEKCGCKDGEFSLWPVLNYGDTRKVLNGELATISLKNDI